jgi:hypothetical protein
VVSSPEDHHDLACLVLNLVYPHLWVSLLQYFGIYQEGLMSQKLGTLLELRLEVSTGFLFEDVAILPSNRVPKFGSSLVNVVEGRQV